jgi:hypothetical protein
MSMFMIYRKKEYAVMLADSLAHKNLMGGSKVTLHAPKLAHVAPCVFATHAGNWQPAYEILSNLHDYLLGTPTPREYREITQYLEEEGTRCFQKWCEVWHVDTHDVRIPIILTGPYRAPEDIDNDISSTCVIIETARKFKAIKAFGPIWAYNDEVTQLAQALFNLPAISYLLNRGPLSLVQALRAIHSFITEICAYISTDRSIVIVGEEDEHHVIEGQVVSLPMRALGF